MTHSANHAYTQARAKVIRTLRGDHRYVLMAFDECCSQLEGGDIALAHALALQTCDDIERHEQLDEFVFSPCLDQALGRELLARRCDIEHQLRSALRELRRWAHPDDPAGRTRFKALGHLFCQHVKLEEGLVFHQLARVRLDWAHILTDLLQRRKELLNETVVVTGAVTYF